MRLNSNINYLLNQYHKFTTTNTLSALPSLFTHTRTSTVKPKSTYRTNCNTTITSGSNLSLSSGLGRSYRLQLQLQLQRPRLILKKYQQYFSLTNNLFNSQRLRTFYTFMGRDYRGGRRGGGGGGGRREGGRGGGSGGGDVPISKALSFTLRHGAIREGLAIRSDGFANVQDLLNMPKFTRLNLTFETLQRLVKESDKQRFQLASIDSNGNPVPIPLIKKNTTITSTTTTSVSEDNPTTTGTISTVSTTSTSFSDPTEPSLNLNHDTPLLHSPSNYLIRATQGHSIPITSTALQLTPLTLDPNATTPQTCIHGTFYAFLDPILASGGLKPMGRNHIHFASDLPSTGTVISGMRKDAQLVFYINLQRALEAGISFWKSENEVILSEGDVTKNGLLGMEFVDRIVDVGSAGLGVIWEQGTGMVKELPKKLRNKGAPRGKERVIRHVSGRGGRDGKGSASRGGDERGQESGVVDEEKEDEA